MRCIKPLVLRDEEDRARTVACGRCNFCLQASRTDWTLRINQELKTADSSHFLTLTYHEDYLDYSPSGLPQLQRNAQGKPEHLQLFFKRLRKANAKYTDKSIRYFAIGEYGETFERPHYHIIAFNTDQRTLNHLTSIWGAGHTYVGTVTPGSIHYVTGYLINRYRDYGDRTRPFSLQSRKPGLGHTYLTTHTKYHRPNENENHWRNYTKFQGVTNRLPRYWRDKIFNREELETLNIIAAQKFDIDLNQELKRLARKFPNRDPHETFKERVQAMHDRIKVIKNKNL